VYPILYLSEDGGLRVSDSVGVSYVSNSVLKNGDARNCVNLAMFNFYKGQHSRKERTLMKKLLALMLCLLPGISQAVLINFDDVVGSQVDITTHYAGLGVTLNSIDNPFPLVGPFPAPATLPTIMGGVTTWLDPFASATSPPQVAVAAANPLIDSGKSGQGGILISSAFEVSSVSLVGNDLFVSDLDDESVTLTAYDVNGNRIGQVYSTLKLPTIHDQTPASISVPGIRYVAYNYTDSTNGFYAIDDLNFTQVPEPTTSALVGLALISVGVCLKRPCVKRG
jgi:hypothetical protein